MGAFLAVLAFTLSAWLTHLFSRPGSTLYLLDYPNERSLHSRPTPRTGGVAVLAAILLAATYGAFEFGIQDGAVIWIGVAGALLTGVSFVDDRYQVPPVYRILVHVFAAVIIVFGGLTLDAIRIADREWSLPLVVGIPVSLLFIVWMINLYNFMDGMDGFAGGMAVIGFGTFGLLGLLANAPFNRWGLWRLTAGSSLCSQFWPGSFGYVGRVPGGVSGQGAHRSRCGER